MNAIHGADTATVTRMEDLRQSTRSAHQSVDDMVMEMAPFDNRDNYMRFLTLQYVFHARMKPLYDAEDLNRVIPGLAARSRYKAVCDDLADLECARPEVGSRFEISAQDAERIGWLYVRVVLGKAHHSVLHRLVGVVLFELQNVIVGRRPRENHVDVIVRPNRLRGVAGRRLLSNGVFSNGRCERKQQREDDEKTQRRARRGCAESKRCGGRHAIVAPNPFQFFKRSCKWIGGL